MRVLDLGCGPGSDLSVWGVNAIDEITGLDIDRKSLKIAKERFPDRTYVLCRGECLPFKEASFERVISGVALPYMSIQRSLSESYRTLVPSGRLSMSLHPPSFTMYELIHNALPKPIPTLFRLYVMANGLLFHCTGKTAGFIRGRTESFQTERGMRIAMDRAGFTDLSFRRGTGPVGETLLVEATKRKSLTDAHDPDL